MKKGLIIGLSCLMVLGLMVLPALADGVSVAGDPFQTGGFTAQLFLEIDISPWASLQLDSDTLTIELADGAQDGSAYVGGHVTTNVPLTLSAEITSKPLMLDGAGNDRSIHADWNVYISDAMQSLPAGTTTVDDNVVNVEVSGVSHQVIAGSLGGGIIIVTIAQTI